MDFRGFECVAGDLGADGKRLTREKLHNRWVVCCILRGFDSSSVTVRRRSCEYRFVK